jgi:plasmid stabilization system protein ParE
VTCTVKLTREAQVDLERLFDFALEGELASETGDLHVPEQAVATIKAGLTALRLFPFTCRKAADGAFLRELVIPFGADGYIALFEITDNNTVAVIAVRRQRESDYH